MSRQEEILFDLRKAMRAAEDARASIDDAVINLHDIAAEVERQMTVLYKAVAQAAETLNRAADEQVPGIAEEV